MGISSILLLLAVLILVGLYLYEPLTAQARRRRDDESPEASALKAERDRVINALQELDFDHKLGKVPAEEYPAQRAALLQKGAEILRRLDEFESGPAASRDAEVRLEQAAAAGRADSAAGGAIPDDEDLEARIAARRRAQKARSAGFCPKCGKPVLVSDRFCPACGKALN